MNNAYPSGFRVVWEDLVDDFLETGCRLSDEERALLLNQLRSQGVMAHAIHAYPSFTIGKKTIVVCDSGHSDECWLYYPKEKKIVIHLPSTNGKTP